MASFFAGLADSPLTSLFISTGSSTAASKNVVFSSGEWHMSKAKVLGTFAAVGIATFTLPAAPAVAGETGPCSSQSSGFQVVKNQVTSSSREYKVVNCGRNATKVKPSGLQPYQGGNCVSVAGWGSYTWYLDRYSYPTGLSYC